MNTTSPTHPAPTAAQRIRLLELAGVMRNHAAKVGPLHSWWDDIADMEAVATDRQPRLDWSAEAWIEEAERILRPAYTPERLAAKAAHWRSGVYNGRPAEPHWQNDSLQLIFGAVPTWVKAGMTLGQIVDRWAAEQEATP